MKLTILFLFFLGACASSQKLVVNTKQEKATVSWYNPSTLSFVELGVTPITVEANPQMSVIRVEKPGYVSENIVLPAERIPNTEIMLDLRANTQWLKKDSASVSKLAEDIGRKLHQINSYTNSRSYGDALKVADDLLQSYPSSSIFYDIKGSLHLLRDEKDLARQSYTKSLELRPDNLQTRKILENLK